MERGRLLELKLALGSGQVNYGRVCSQECRRKLSWILENLVQGVLPSLVGGTGMSRGRLAEE